MSGLIGVPCSDSGRYSAFSESLANLRRPEGSEIKFAIGTWRHRARNQLVNWMFEMDGEWLLMIDDDHVFDSGILEQLLSHNVDVVAGLCLRRDEPYTPFCFTEAEDGRYTSIDLALHEPQLVQVAAVGTGLMLVRRSIFERLEEPWFTVTDTSGEDMRFCDRLREAEIPIYCDLAALVGHLTTAMVIPACTKSGWKTGFLISDETRLTQELSSPETITA